ncbi:MAG: alpha/beta hydrolase, partial [Spirochaetes bacterium]|nr:alpha/beta hydrolase [Spirochaetota bacterium]
MQADIPIALLLAGILSSSCLTTQPLDPAISYRERLWAEIGPLSLPFEELLWRDKPIGPETLRYLHTYGFEPVSGIPTQWKVSLGLLFDQDSQAREPYLVQPSSCTQPSHPSLPPLGVLVGLPTLHLDGERPRNHVRGTVFLVHGYLDHSGSWSPVIKKILSERFVVVALDLPGHGVSGGIRGDIEDFSQYGEAVRRVRDWA